MDIPLLRARIGLAERQTTEHDIELPRGLSQVGRGLGTAVVVTSPHWSSPQVLHPSNSTVSKHHLDLQLHSKGLYVRDVGSLNGAYYVIEDPRGENRIQSVSLLPGNHYIVIGENLHLNIEVYRDKTFLNSVEMPLSFNPIPRI